MKYTIKATKIKLTPEIKEYVDKKINMLDKYLGKIQPVACHVEVGLLVGGQKTGDIYRTEVVLELPNSILVIEKSAEDLTKSIDKVKDHLAQSITKYKEKLIERRRKTA
ncbi:ribosome-associated translation inhibitor RaiA [Candidatus Falkowbacteria bacterium]|nr:ribosome-associated translation inhibitor RaiA [Candidatus Falkowbacteria bacterium]